MDAKTLTAALSILLFILNAFLYIRSVLRGRTRPHAFSWGIWALIAAIVFFAQSAEGAGPGAWVQAVNAFLALAVMILGLTRGDRDYKARDWAALAFALLSIPLWFATSTPLWSVFLLCAIDAAGFYPTFRKSWDKPYEEPMMPYAIWTFSALVSIIAIEQYSLTTVLYPAVIAALNMALVGTLTARRQEK